MTKSYMTGTEFGEKLLASVRQMKEGKVGRVTVIDPEASTTAAKAARGKTGLSQTQFAKLMGVSVRTLQEWEQGRREPSGAACTLLKIAAKRPDAVLEAVA